MQKELKLNRYQKEYLKSITSKKLVDIPKPWYFRNFFHMEGILAFGWTHDNFLFLCNSDEYQVINVSNLDTFIQGREPYEKLNEKMLQFYLPELNERIRIYGLYCGNGKSMTQDGWELKTFYHSWPNSVVGIKHPIDYSNLNRPHKKIWEEYDLVKLNTLEYFDLFFSFSLDENAFVIQGSGGIELFSR